MIIGVNQIQSRRCRFTLGERLGSALRGRMFLRGGIRAVQVHGKLLESGERGAKFEYSRVACLGYGRCRPANPVELCYTTFGEAKQEKNQNFRWASIHRSGPKSAQRGGTDRINRRDVCSLPNAGVNADKSGAAGGRCPCRMCRRHPNPGSENDDLRAFLACLEALPKQFPTKFRQVVCIFGIPSSILKMFAHVADATGERE